jgi:type IV fimbrial biogenesis protein FimT
MNFQSFRFMSGRQRGVTLLELMVGLTVLAIVTTMAVPSFARLIENNRLVTRTNDLVTALALARSEAMKRSLNVSLCPSSDGETCTEDDDWSGQWLLFTDDTGAQGEFDPGPNGDVLIQKFEAGPEGFVQSANVESIQFWPNGLAMPALDKTFDFHHEGCSGERARQIVVNNVGRVTTTRVNCP